MRLIVGFGRLPFHEYAVDGVYDSDPRTNPDAKLYSEISPREVIEHGLKVADATAVAMARDNDLRMIFFNLETPGNIGRVVNGEPIGTTVH